MSLGHNHFEDEAAMFLRNAIVDNSHLEVLDLSWNKFRMKGAEYITDIILVSKQGSTLNTINLA